MELEREAYQALEDIVGPEYISQDPAIMDTYNQVWGNKLVFDEKWSLRPAAVLLPSTTEEVQAIVRACNRYKIGFKPFSSGFEIVSLALDSEKSITLDLRRMNRIIEIDVKNMRAVVEPFVSVYRLQMELAKYGLYIGTVSAGPEAGIIASSCCHMGTGATQVFTSGSGRNTLGCEWVLPNGELLTMGSAEAGCGWFSADGPGFGLRGALRGRSGANGGNGVITKVSAKLYPWYGPPEWELVGRLPGVKQPEKVLDGYKVFVFTFPNEDDSFDAMREIGQAQIAYAVLRTLAGRLGESNEELWEELKKIPEEEMLKSDPSLQVCIGGNSKREIEYREKCLFKICERWGGKLLPEKNTPDLNAWRQLILFWGIGCVKDLFRMCPEALLTPQADVSQDAIKNIRKAAIEAQLPYKKRGVMMKVAPLCFSIPYENYSTGTHIENNFCYDPWDPETAAGVREYLEKSLDPNGKFKRFGVPNLGGGLQIERLDHIHENWGPVYENYDVWLRKIRQALDPNGVGEGSAYIPPIFP